MNKLEKLIADHAYWTAERNRLKREGEEEYSKCNRTASNDRPYAPLRKTCIAQAYQETRELNESEPDCYTFDETFCNLMPCQHCVKTRELKRQRMYAGQRLGAVRSAITRVGKRILAQQELSAK